MPRRGGKGKQPLSCPPGPSSKRQTRSSGQAADNVPGVFYEMLAEIDPGELPTEGTTRSPRKKRKLGADPLDPGALTTVDIASQQTTLDSGYTKNDVDRLRGTHRSLQTVDDSSDSNDSDDEDMDFEDVDLGQRTNDTSESQNHLADVSIVVPGAVSTSHSRTRRMPLSAMEKSHRLLVHKTHLLCLLGHCIYINSWCNDAVAQQQLLPILSKKTLSLLNLDSSRSQFQRHNAFLDGLKQAFDAFNVGYQVTEYGMRRPQWRPAGAWSEFADDTDSMDRTGFRKAASRMQGSQDTGNQLFCCLLRAAGVEARIVCSPQVLPFTSVPTKSAESNKAAKAVVLQSALSRATLSPGVGSTEDEVAARELTSTGKLPQSRRRLGRPSFGTPEVEPRPTPPRAKLSRKLSFPVFWVEAFDAAHQKWIPVDPVVTLTVGKPTKLEPPSCYDANQLSYVFAFEDDGVARDITRRYAKAYNAKTRQQRIESTERGQLWLKKVLRFFRRSDGVLDRDQVEDSELVQNEAREGLPKRVQDFRHHPHYALERHLKRHEVIQPRREVGKINAGTAAKPRMESVFRRQDVVVCKSADRWYRLGRQIQQGELPVKHVPARSSGRTIHVSADEALGESHAMTGLYTPYQTVQYVPLPVVDGRIKKNAFGNLEVFVPSMVPRGGVHIKNALVRDAARILRIDCADAVTGFQFRGRSGTAVVEGAVVAEEYAEAVNAVIDAMTDDRIEQESMARSATALSKWRRLIKGLRIQAHVRDTYGNAEGDSGVAESRHSEADGLGEGAGGFFPNDGADQIALPTAGRFSLDQLNRSVKEAKKASKAAASSSESEDGMASEVDWHDHLPDTAEPNQEPEPFCNHSVPKTENDHLPEEPGPKEIAQQYLIDPVCAEAHGGGFVPENRPSPPLETKPPGPTAQGQPSPEPAEVQRSLVPADTSMREVETPVFSPSPSDEDRREGSGYTSMISHDPEDEDAEPDWLQSE